MKKIFSIFVLAIFIATFHSCTNDVTDLEPNIVSKTETLSFAGKPSANGKSAPVTGTVTVNFDIDQEAVTSIQLDENLSNYLNLTDDQLENMVESESEPGAKHDHAACISGCNATFTNEDGTKKPGRGACKFNCWVSTTVQVLQAVASIASST